MTRFGSIARAGVLALGALVALGAQPVVSAVAASPPGTAPVLSYYPAGPQVDVPVATVTNGGWTQCYLDQYENVLGEHLASLLYACTGDHLLLAGREKGSDTLSLAAMAPRSDVLFDTGETGDTADEESTDPTHNANGSEWYFHDDGSWGFANGGDSARLAPCDVTPDTIPGGSLRLCWHTTATNGGFRLGTMVGLNYSDRYERVVYQASGTPMAQQAITFTSTPPTKGVLGATYAVSATGGASGNPVTFSIAGSSSGACSVYGSTVTFNHAGTCVINANQAGNAVYAAAPTKRQSITVGQSTQAITFTSRVPSEAAAVVGAKYVVAATGGTSGMPVTYSVDDSRDTCTIYGSTVTFVHPGLCTVWADQDGNEDTTAAPTAEQEVFVSQALTATRVSVHPTTISAQVSVTAPGAGEPTDLVWFSVGGTNVGSASVVGGVATLAYTVPSGATRTVGAQYVGDSDFADSTGTTTRSDPRITAKVSSSKGKSRYGWYRTTVTVRFTCTTNGAPLTTACPAAVTLRSSRANQSVTRSILATNGGRAKVSVTKLNIDLGKPKVRISGVKSGATYIGSVPRAKCVASDQVSKVASCRVTRKASGTRSTWTAVATDKAGNVATTSVRATVKPKPKPKPKKRK